MTENSSLSKKNYETALNAMTEAIVTALKAEDKVQLVGFGSFEVKMCTTCAEHNSRTKESKDTIQ